MTVRESIKQMTDTLRQEFRIAWQQTVQVGNPYPLVEFYNANERELQENYNITLNDLLELDGDFLQELADGSGGTTAVNPPIEGNPLSQLVTKNPKRTERRFSTVAILAFAAGAYLIFKSFKK